MKHNFKELFPSLRGNLLILVASMIIWTFTAQMIQTYEPLYIFALGGTGVIFGMISALQTLLGMFLRMPGGYVADTYGRSRLIGVVTIFTSFSCLFYVFAKNWTWIVIGASLASFTSLYIPALEAIRADSVKPEERGRGYVLLNALPQIPAIIAPTLGGILILDKTSKYGIRLEGAKTVYFLLFLGMIIAGLIRLFFLKETLPSQPERGRRFVVNSFKEVHLTVTDSDQSVRLLMVLTCFFMFCFHFEVRLRAAYAISVKGLSTVDWGIIVSLSQVFSIAAIFAVGWLIDAFGRKKIFIPSIAFLGIAVYLFTVSNTLLSFLVSMIVIATCEQSRMMAFQVLIADSTPRTIRGRIFSIMDILSSLGSSASVLLSGLLYDFNRTLPFYVATIMYSLATLIAIKFLRESKVRHI